MFGRLNQLSRHISRPVLNSVSTPSTTAATTPAVGLRSGPATMTSCVRDTKTIHTAGCLIIGDEVLGGKVGSLPH